MKKKDLTVHIMVGLPGSGKSCFAKTLSNNHTVVFDEFAAQDRDYRIYNIPSRKRFNPLEDSMWGRYLSPGAISPWVDTVVLDGLFLENDRILRVLDLLASGRTIKAVMLHIWNEDREECKRNDWQRRRCGCGLSIDALSIKVDPKVIREKYPHTTVQHHTVYHTPDYAVFFRNFADLTDEAWMRSEPWIIGGYSRDYEGNSSPIDPEEQPNTFVALVQLMRSVWPDIPFLAWQNILDQAVSIEEIEENDYYSCIQKRRYACDMAKMYDLLLEAGFDPGGKKDLLTQDEMEALEAVLNKDADERTALEDAAKKLWLYYKNKD